MMRLLQGDVGSGKTAVAALALAFAADAGHQGALLAPTDLLARQHAQTLGRLLEPLGHDVTLLTGSLSAAARREVLDLLGAPLERTLDGRTRGRIVVGTHALVQEAVAFEDLRLAVVDEQHRFGVAEREALTSKGGAPHVLLMTATPIPRTLGQIVHADLDVSDLRTPPAGRQEIGTAIRAHRRAHPAPRRQPRRAAADRPRGGGRPSRLRRRAARRGRPGSRREVGRAGRRDGAQRLGRGERGGRTRGRRCRASRSSTAR